MTAIVPDTLQGALIVSVIDFFLSFLIISGIGVVLSLFPLLNRVSRLTQARSTPDTAIDKKKTASLQSKTDVPNEVIAAISAAVFAAMEGNPHRIIDIAPSPIGDSWAKAGRMAHHGSHNPLS